MKQHFTLKQHEETGEKLRKVKILLNDIDKASLMSYAKTKGLHARCTAAMKAVAMLNCVLDDILFDEHPEMKLAELTQYYYKSANEGELLRRKTARPA